GLVYVDHRCRTGTTRPVRRRPVEHSPGAIRFASGRAELLHAIHRRQQLRSIGRRSRGISIQWYSVMATTSRRVVHGNDHTQGEYARVHRLHRAEQRHTQRVCGAPLERKSQCVYDLASGSDPSVRFLIAIRTGTGDRAVADEELRAERTDADEWSNV